MITQRWRLPLLQRSPRQNRKESHQHHQRQERRREQRPPRAQPHRRRRNRIRPRPDQARAPRSAPPSRKTEAPVETGHGDETQFPGSGTQAREHHARHFRGDRAAVCVSGCERYEQHPPCRDCCEETYAQAIGDGADDVGEEEFGEEGGDDVAEEDDAFGYRGADEIQGRGEDDYVENIVYEACD